MDFGGVVGLEGLMGASSGGGAAVLSSSLAYSDPETWRQMGLFGSGQLKHGRCFGPEEHELRSFKVGRSEAVMAAPNKAAPSFLRSNSHSLFPDGEQMLSFSTSKQDAMLISGDGSLPYYHHTSSTSSAASYMRNAGLVSGFSNASMHGVLAGVRGPFTPSQWMELEHQALIYKYIDANMPIPPSLLNSIRRGLNPSGFSTFSAGSFRSNTLGWGSLHLGFSGSIDPEPGRCRRTDGKKWRCSRDAVADQKYCERHMNRGRHRSRKHVEGHCGNAAKLMPTMTPSQSASAISDGGLSNSLSIAQRQIKSLQPNVTESYDRMLMSKESANVVQDSQGLSMLTAENTKPINTLFPISKQHNAFEGSSSGTDFRLISSHSKDISFDQQSQSHPLRHFIDDWPKDQSDRATISWPVIEEAQSDRTQLSISIPKASSDFSSSSSPNQEKLALSPLRLSKEFDPIHMSLGVGGIMNEANQRQANWIPISWEDSLGGPLGEVLANTNSTPKEYSKNCSSLSLDLLTDSWDLRSSPTDVLQKTTFGSLSSCSGSSPRADNHKGHGNTSSLCEDLLGSMPLNPSPIPLL